MARLICVLLILILIQINCAPSVELTRFDSSPRTPKTGDIDVYTDPQSIQRSYKEIALLTVKENEFGSKDQTMFDELIRKAKQIGADGVIILSQEIQSEGGYFFTPAKKKKKSATWTHYSESTRKVLRASVIVYEEE